MNKETLQNYNSKLSENNISLEDINNTINELPDVGNMIEKFEITDGQYLFYRDIRLELIEIFAKLLKNVTNASSMFNYSSLKTFDANVFDTSTWKSIKGMFSNMQQLTSIDVSKLDTSNVEEMNDLFINDSKLIELDLRTFNISKVKIISQFVASCSSLVTLNLDGWDASEINTANNCYNNCNSLTNLTFMNNFGKGFTIKQNNYIVYKINLSYSTKLTHESLMDVINKLYDLNLTYDVANGGTLYTQQLVLGADNIAKLTENEIAIATNKGWVVS